MTAIAWALISTEAIKLRRTPALWLAVAAPVLAILLEFVILFNRISRPMGDGSAMWRNLLFSGGAGWAWWLGFFAPMLISFEAAALANLEHGAKQWKQLFSLPIPRWSVYATKMLFCGFLVGASFLAIAVGFVGDVLIYSGAHGLHLAASIPCSDILSTTGKAYAACWLAVVIQSWLGARFAGIAAPVGIGFAALAVGVVLLPFHGGDFSSWYPLDAASPHASA